jgi:hypothetical protein
MKKNLITNPFRPIVNMIKRSSFVIFVVVVASGLVVSVLTLTNILINPLGGGPSSKSTVTTGFDQATINRLNKLTESSNSSKDQTLPSGRINPFSG